jgi:GTP-binding protein
MTINSLFGGECKFVAGAAAVEQIPATTSMPEVAFAGRSNVGKSSLINALVNRKNFARTSRFPGRTQQINFFTIADKISLADLPGYGYAAVSKQIRRSWDWLLLHYLNNRQNLRRVFLLIDARHGIKNNDEEMMDILDDCGAIYQIILTKADKTSSILEIEDGIIRKIAHRGAAFPAVISTSTKCADGINDVRREIAGLLM